MTENKSYSVKLLAHTIPTLELIEDFTVGEFIAYCAKVSNPSNQANTLTMGKLLKYLKTHHHWSPFEMANMVVEIKTTRDITRQIIRHRSFSFQEFSQRYAAVDSSQYMVRGMRLQDPFNRQNSAVPEWNEETLALNEQWLEKQLEVIKLANSTYQWALDNHIAKEQARAVLPEGNTASTLIMNGTIRSWIHYCDLRSANGTQLEHMVIAKEIQKILDNLMAEMITRNDELDQLNIQMQSAVPIEEKALDS